MNEELLKKLVDAMKEDPETLGKSFNNVGRLLPILELIKDEARKAEEDRIFKKLGEKIDGVVLNSLRKQLKGDKK